MNNGTALASLKTAGAFYRVHWRPLLLGGFVVVSGLAIATMVLGPVATFFLTALTAGFYATAYSVIDSGTPSWRLFPETVTKRIGKLVGVYLGLTVLTLLLTAIGAGVFIALTKDTVITARSTALFVIASTPVAAFVISTAMRFMLVATIREDVGFVEALRINLRIWRTYPVAILSYTIIRAALFVLPALVVAVGVLTPVPVVLTSLLALLIVPFFLSFVFTYHVIFYEAVATKMQAPWRDSKTSSQ